MKRFELAESYREAGGDGDIGGLVGALTVVQSKEIEAGLKGLVLAHERVTAFDSNPAGVG